MLENGTIIGYRTVTFTDEATKKTTVTKRLYILKKYSLIEQNNGCVGYTLASGGSYMRDGKSVKMDYFKIPESHWHLLDEDIIGKTCKLSFGFDGDIDDFQILD